MMSALYEYGGFPVSPLFLSLPCCGSSPGGDAGGGEEEAAEEGEVVWSGSWLTLSAIITMFISGGSNGRLAVRVKLNVPFAGSSSSLYHPVKP